MSADRLSWRRPAWAGALALAALILGLGGWSVTAELSGAVVTQGRVTVDGQHVALQHPEGGVVAGLFVRDGARVTAGQPLVRLDGAALQSDLRMVEDRLTDLAARIARLEAERDGRTHPEFPADLLSRARQDAAVAALVAGQTSLFQARLATLADLRAQLERRIAQGEARIRGLSAQILATQDLARLAEQDLARQRPLLAQGLVPQTAVLALEREVARLSGEAGALAAASAGAADEIAEIGLQIASLVAQRREAAMAELRELAPLQAELVERRQHLRHRIDRLTLRAPVAGTVLGLAVAAPGAVLAAGDTALQLVPLEAPLVIAARVPPLHRWRIAPGQSAELVFPALASGSDAPRLTGQVADISPDALPDPAGGSPAYALRIAVPAAEISRLGDRAFLPGLEVQVFLKTGSRRPLDYLVDPFARYISQAFRED
jgi:HlyD family secretion protein